MNIPTGLTFTLQFTSEELSIISQALMEVPAKFANPILTKLEEQAAAQLKPKQADVKPTAPKAEPEGKTEPDLT